MPRDDGPHVPSKAVYFFVVPGFADWEAAHALAEVDPADVALFVLPGGDRWEQQPLERELVDVRAGLLRGRRHTSNGLEYLKRQVPTYTEAANYVDAPAVRDGGLITATGLADVEFAREIMTELAVLAADDRANWANLFRGGRLPAGGA